MTNSALTNMSADQLVAEFKRLAIVQGRAMAVDDNDNYNRIFDSMKEVERELRTREGDQRYGLLSLLDDADPHVRLKSAIAVLKIAPERARMTLQDIVDANEYPQAANARGMLMALDEGRYVPE